MSLIERIESPGQKRMLAIDGGGIRGVLALSILQRIEDILKAQSGREEFRLADYFDYIAGTSTGGIIAAGLSIGMSVRDVLQFYLKNGAQMFERASLLQRLRYKFESEPLARQLKSVFRADTQLGSDRLQTLLLLVMRNASTDSPWPLSNNPYAKYNDPGRPDCNLQLPLWQLVRASSAAPSYFPPEVISLPSQNNAPGRQFIFVDGGVTMYNNPAFQMFLMATVDRYWLRKPEARWNAGADNMLLVSVGTGTSADVRTGLNPDQMNLLFDATTIPSALMFAALNEQDLLCRVFGRCLAGDPIDRETGDLIGSGGPLATTQKLFTYLRYNAELTRCGLDDLGCNDVNPATVQKLDSISGIPDLQKVGEQVAKLRVSPAHFAGFPAKSRSRPVFQ
ncbi:patatin-like phospholipase family protein [Mesorhizobium sp. AR02]|uniref:patatin-like phospholipase family protein n=1 Tax=Mesorhizobium sp. AR02 TaxID=2865837 RepID=UPI00215F5567|nr:patatin-like phospholipase family protein [Mesorhizobium sp. AR02]UVK55352.1 patatin-like phospholipase family protein [Mesorhizobium sp. AR02]